MYELENIPDDFRSDGEAEKFHECTLCSADLSNSKNPYFIEKGFKNYPDGKGRVTLFEFAICMACREKEFNALSKESREKIMEYQSQIQEEIEDHKQNPGSEIDFDEYVKACVCLGNQMICGSSVTMTQESMDDILKLLSEPSQDHLRDLTDRLVTIPPELEPLFDGTPKPILF